ncbi:MAG: glycoside hydrolase family 28 protein [Lysobacterales bacterium]|jgi:polygalacturonase
MDSQKRAMTRRDLLKTLGSAALTPTLLACAGYNSPDPWSVAPGIRAQIREPEIPAAGFVITGYGAVGDGKTDCTKALADAIATASAVGGGRVIVPPGVFMTGPVHLESHVELHLEKGATLSFIPEPERYLPAVFTRWEGVEFMGLSPLIYAYGKTDIAVTGEGTLDGGADDTHWWPWKGKWKGKFLDAEFTQKAARDRLFADAEAGVPPGQRDYALGAYLRPPFIQAYKCRNVLIEGVTITNSPFWLINPVLSTSVTVRGVTCSSMGPNSDGCDPESCKNVLIEDCVFDTGDDCIAIKSGRNADGRRVNVPSENIIVANCEMKAGHGGVVMGSELSGGIRNVFVENCRMSSPDLERGIRIKTNAMRGGGVQNLNVRNLEIGNVKDLFVVNFFYEEGDKGPYSPVVRNLELRDIECANARRVMDLRGFGHAPIRDVRLTGVTVESAAEASIISNAVGLVLDRVTVNGSPVTTTRDLLRDT